jgi:hypothetical protein
MRKVDVNDWREKTLSSDLGVTDEQPKDPENNKNSKPDEGPSFQPKETLREACQHVAAIPI